MCIRDRYITNQNAVEGAMIQMLSHGVVSAALFLCVGILYDRMHTREISFYGGLIHKMPKYAVFFMIFTLASIGLPGTSGFIGEFLIILSAFKINTWLAFFSTFVIILGAAYMLHLYRRIIFGIITNTKLKQILDLNIREIIILTPIVIAIFWIGIHPNTFLKPMQAPIEKIIKNYNIANE